MSTLQRYAVGNKVGVSPLEMGPTLKLPLELWELLNAYIDITQLEGNAETKPRILNWSHSH